MTDEPRYIAAKRGHERWRSARWRIIVGFPLALALITNVFQLESGWVFNAVMFGLCGTAMILGQRYANIRCPRCGKTFYSRAFYNNGLAKSCLHCGLRDDATRDPKHSSPTNRSDGRDA